MYHLKPLKYIDICLVLILWLSTGPILVNSPSALERMSVLGVPGWLSWLSVQLLISAQVTVSWFVGLSPALGSALTTRNLLGFSFSSLSLCPFPAHALSLPLKINKLKKKRTAAKPCLTELQKNIAALYLAYSRYSIYVKQS